MIRPNRDTLYSAALVDISRGATLTRPDAGDRYLSVMVVNNDPNAYSYNNLTATPNDDGATVHFGGCSDDRPNCLPINEGWDYSVRLCQPHPEILDGTCTFPTAEAI